MKEARHPRGLRDRKSHLSPDAERLVAAALGLSNSGSRTEDRFWETALAARIERLLDGGHAQAVSDALDRLNQADTEAYSALIEAVEDASESLVIEVDDTQRFQRMVGFGASISDATAQLMNRNMSAAQREVMFVTEALAGDATALTDALRARLARLEQLCPGDFAAVKRQTDILAATFSPEEFLEQLEAEHRIKPEVREARSMGFLQ